MIDGPEQEKRKEIFLSQLRKKELKAPFPSRWTCPQVQPWLYGYDAYEEVHKALAENSFTRFQVIAQPARPVIPSPNWISRLFSSVHRGAVKGN
jgi:salicylate hydroxylase